MLRPTYQRQSLIHVPVLAELPLLLTMDMHKTNEIKIMKKTVMNDN